MTACTAAPRCGAAVHALRAAGRQADGRAKGEQYPDVVGRIVADLVENRYAVAVRVTLVQDNLRAHKPAAMYEVFGPERAKAILDRIVSVRIHPQARLIVQHGRN